jgi:(p)ppGpp synthase/HD superfamily hydrolase
MTTQIQFPCVTKQQLLIILEKFSLQNNQQILKAIAFSEQIHLNQKRDSGKSYLEEHIFPLIVNLVNHHPDHSQIIDLIIVGLLHDTVEDGDIKSGVITKMFNNKIENQVCLLTKEKQILSEKPNQDWLYNQTKANLKKVKNGGEITILVKLEDRLQNLESTVTILPNKEEKYTRMLKEVIELFIPMTNQFNQKFNYKNKFLSEISRINLLFPNN